MQRLAPLQTRSTTSTALSTATGVITYSLDGRRLDRRKKKVKRLDPLPLPTPSVPDEPLDLRDAAPKHGYLAAALKFLGEGEWCDAGIGAIYAQVEDERAARASTPS